MMEPTAETDIVTIDGKQYSRAMAEQMVSDIEIVHAINPRTWALHSWENEPLLAVGKINVLSIGPSTPYGLIVASDRLADLDPERLAGVEIRRRTYDGREWGMYLWLDAAHVHQNLRLLRKAHEEAVSRLAGEYRRTVRWSKHREDFRTMLTSITGVDVPEPAYLYDIPNVSATDPVAELVQVYGRRYWKISPGRGGSEWEKFRNRSLMAIGWSEVAADVTLFPDEEDTFITAVRTDTGVSVVGARSLWMLSREVQVGDHVLAYSNRQILGHGIVTGEYAFVQDDFAYMHRRPVRWESTESRSVDNTSSELQQRLSRQATLFELSPAQFAEAIGAPSDAQPTATLRIEPLTVIRSQFAANGLHYTNAQIATFYTALQTKGFVVLSGISGTGKSKIATGFVEMLPNWQTSNETPLDDPIVIEVKPYMQRGRQIHIPSKYMDRFNAFSEFKGVTVPLVIGTDSGSANLRYEMRNGRASIELWLHGHLRSVLADLPVGETLILEPDFDEDHEVSSIHISLLNDYKSSHPETAGASHPVPNHLFLSVRPDWRDSTSLLGYYNPLTETYEWTDFLRFIIRAGENFEGDPKDRIAWFVILDEMNLAHVEYYFADLLSVLESGRHMSGDREGWTMEALRLTYPDSLLDDAPPDHEIYLPPNLYIIGTVNMDETTHAFSPKVLDRAFTIELTDVDFTNYHITGGSGSSAGLSGDERQALLTKFSRNGRFARIDKVEAAAAVDRHPEIRDSLQALNELLSQNRLHFGYRVFDEIAMYLAVNDENGMMLFREAFDEAVFMKVLPKFSGSLARLESPLHKVLAWAIDPGQVTRADIEDAVRQFNDWSDGKATGAWLTTPVFPRVAGRVRDMLVALRTDGFVSFG